jgi:hypothetical protein
MFWHNGGHFVPKLLPFLNGLMASFWQNSARKAIATFSQIDGHNLA